MENGNVDDFDFDNENYPEPLQCSFSYIKLCLVLPALTGLLHGFLWPAYTLYFDAMHWPLALAGLAISTGFGCRFFLQQCQLRTGYWLIVPLSAIHLIVAILALIYQMCWWAVFAQIVVWLGIDPTCAIEGIAFDIFCDSELQARQATSTVLSVFTIAFAFSCTFGGILFDSAGWAGMAVYHISLQGLVLLLLACEPACRHSFVAVFFKPEMEPDELGKGGQAQTVGTIAAVHVVPALAAELPGAVEEVKEEPNRRTLTLLSLNSDASPRGAQIVPVNPSRLNVMTGGTGVTGNTLQTLKTKQTAWSTAGRLHLVRRRDARSGGRESVLSLGTKCTNRSKATVDVAAQGRLKRAQARLTARSVTSGISGAAVSRQSNFSRFSSPRISVLPEAGRHFQNHFAASQALLPQIIGARGRESVQREELQLIDETGAVVEAEIQHIGASLPTDIWLPALCIQLNSFCNTGAYILVYASFAIYFNQVHHRADAALAGMTQMAGDVVGALAMQVIPLLFRQSANPDDLGYFRRFWYYLLSKPYTLSVTLFTWILFNLAMMTPSLPVAIAAQVLVGTTFVYSCKWSTDMSLFYSMGDSRVFLSLQERCRNADAIGGCVAGILATGLFSLDPAAPFICGAAMACVVLHIYTVTFCLRVGFGDLETAEERRAEHLGLRRERSAW